MTNEDFSMQLAALDEEFAARVNEEGGLPLDDGGAQPSPKRGVGDKNAVIPGQGGSRPYDDAPVERTDRERQLDAARREERERRKRAQREADELRAQMAHKDANFQTLLTRALAQQGQGGGAQQGNQPSVQYINARDIEQAPLQVLATIANGYNQMIYEREVAERQAQEQRAQQAQLAAAQRQQAEAMQRFVSELHDAEGDFRNQRPDYDDAAAYAVSARVEQVANLYPTWSREQVVGLVQNEVLGGAWEARAAGMSPAEAIYRAALSLGYTPGAKDKQGQRKDDRKPDARDPLKHMRDGQPAARNMNAGGRVPAGDDDLSDLLSLKGADFEKAAAEYIERMTG